jgi:hypothetical protein
MFGLLLHVLIWGPVEFLAYNNNNNNNNNNILLTPIGLSPGGSGHLTHIKTRDWFATKFT